MKVLNFAILLVIILVALFTASNWDVLTRPTPLSFLVFHVEGPLGIILLSVMLGLLALVMVYVLSLRTASLVESNRLHRQLEEQRELAEKAETSRIAALRELLAQELAETRTAIQDSGAAGRARTEAAETSLSATLAELSNTLVANLGYIDDKVSRPSPGGDS